MGIALFIFIAAIILSIPFALGVGRYLKRRENVCQYCGDEATWVWMIAGQETLICDWHNAEFQMGRYGRPDRRIDDADAS